MVHQSKCSNALTFPTMFDEFNNGIVMWRVSIETTILAGKKCICKYIFWNLNNKYNKNNN